MTVYTVGHSNLPMDTFLSLLSDIRSVRHAVTGIFWWGGPWKTGE